MSSHFLIINGDIDSCLPALKAGVTEVTLDLEDSVPADRKPLVRSYVGSFLHQAKAAGVYATLKLNALCSLHGIDDIRFISELDVAPDGYLLARVDSVEEVSLLDSLIRGASSGARFCVVIETPHGLANVEKIAAHPRVESLIMGGKDLSKFSRMKRDWEPLLYARSRVINAAAMAGIEVYDEPYFGERAGFAENCARSKATGFTGRTTIDPDEVALINEIFKAS